MNSGNKTAFTLTIRGRGGHGSRPDAAINPVDCFAAAYGAMRDLAASLGGSFRADTVDGGRKTNIIPETVRFSGTFEGTDAAAFSARLPAVLDGVCAAFSCTAEFEEKMT